ncbi:MAG: hypothetical protein Q8935_18580, partial [Bacillota bacterium]|nr:hypothetical protein [Bacillota bacterium]
SRRLISAARNGLSGPSTARAFAVIIKKPPSFYIFQENMQLPGIDETKPKFFLLQNNINPSS